MRHVLCFREWRSDEILSPSRRQGEWEDHRYCRIAGENRRAEPPAKGFP